MNKADKDLIKDLYTNYGHKSIRVRYHIILVTKYRRKCLTDIKEQVFNIFKSIEQHAHIKIYNMNIDKDHIHLLISFPPEYSISQTINRLKQYTTNQLYKSCYDHLKKYYRTNKNILWSHNYFCSTLGMISETKVNEYINKQ